VDKTAADDVVPCEDELVGIVDSFVKGSGGRIPAEELRRRLGVRPEDLTEDLDAAEAQMRPPP
jgi:hypothetical protein